MTYKGVAVPDPVATERYYCMLGRTNGVTAEHPGQFPRTILESQSPLAVYSVTVILRTIQRTSSIYFCEIILSPLYLHSGVELQSQ